MAAEKTVARIGRPGEELRPPHRIEAGLRGDHGADRVRLEFELPGKPPRPHGGANPAHRLHALGVESPQRGEQPAQKRPLGRALLGLRNVPGDVMRRLVAQDEGQFVGVARVPAPE